MTARRERPPGAQQDPCAGGAAPAITDEEHLRYVAFAKSVLALHQRLEFPALGRTMCSCGWLPAECAIRGLADRLGLP